MIVARGAVFVEPGAALVAEAGTEMILGAAATAVGQFAAWHGDKEAFDTFNALQVADHEHVVKGNRAKCEQALVATLPVVHEFDADFGDLHGCPPCALAGP